MSLSDDLHQEPEVEGTCTSTSDTLTFNGITSDKPLKVQKDWSPIFELFGKDPDDFVIVNDTVSEQISLYQQSKRLEGGDRDTVTLRAYKCSASFRRRPGPDKQTVNDLIASVRAWKPARRTPGAGLGTPVTYAHVAADWQLGNGEGGGTPATKQRILDGIERSIEAIRVHRKFGRNIEGVAFINGGDHTEAVSGHYASQTHSVDLNLRDQLALALELNVSGIEALAPLVDKFTYAACLCNHGEWQRQGGKSITGDADNSTGFLGDTLRLVCASNPNLSHIDWIVPRDEMVTVADFSGVFTAMAHGHKITGTEENWLTRQSGRLLMQHGQQVKLWVTAHKHHANVTDFGPYHRLQATSVDNGSKWFTDTTGKWATQGTTTFLIGRHDPRCFSNYEVV